MTDVKLSKIAGGGGGFTAKFASPVIVLLTGFTGTFVTLTPPSGQKVRLTGLSSAATLTSLTTVTVGGLDVVTDVFIERTDTVPVTADKFKIGFGDANSVYIDGAIDEVVELKTNVATSSIIYYSYQFGE